MNQTNQPVIILGAGIGGLAVAAALLQKKVDVVVVEQAAKFARIGAGIQMTPNAVRVLDGLGIRHVLDSHAFAPKSSLNRDYRGEITNEFPLAEHALERYGMPFYAMHRADLHTALDRLVPNEKKILGKKVIDIVEHDDGVELFFADGTTMRGQQLIAADGVHSPVRDKIFGASAPQYTGRVAYRTTFPRSQLKGFDIGDSRTKWWGKDRHIVIYYVTKNKDEVYFVTSQPEDAAWMTPESWSSKGDVQELRDAYAEFHGDVRAVLNACDDVYKWAIFKRDPLPNWVSRRIVLLGDACHPMTPYMAQGAAMALEDAVVLSRCYTDSGLTDFQAIGQLFEAIRKPRCSAVQAGAEANNWMKNKTNPDWVYGYNAWDIALSPDSGSNPHFLP
ncbi:MAG: FAD-dependent monooxygenase [Pigmentiphaga sp.]